MNSRLLLVTLLALSWSGLQAIAATSHKEATPVASTDKTHQPVVAELPKSVFNAIQGRNPFFPANVIQPITNDFSGTPITPTPVGFFLNGIVPPGGAAKPTAMINGHTFEAGETAEVKVANGTKVLIKCEEIRADSVIISREGLKQELTLRPGAL